MAKANVKTITMPVTGTATAVTTVTVAANGSVNSGPPVITPVTIPAGQEITGTLQDIQSGTIYSFRQPLGDQLGIAVVDAKVSYTLCADATGKLIAVSVKLVDHGVIQTMNADGESGTLLDRSSKQIIAFVQPLAVAMGITAPVPGTNQKGSVVSFERVVDPTSGAYVAVALNL